MLTTCTNADFIRSYLELYDSPQSKKIRAHRLATFFKFVGNKSICTITYDEYMQYFLGLKSRTDYTIATKRNMWLILRSFVEYVQESTSTFINFPKKIAKWGTINKPTKDTTETIMDKPYIDGLLDKAKILDYKKYIQLLLLKDTGMSVSELVTIRTAIEGGTTIQLGVNVEERYVITGTVPGAQKHAKGGQIVYCFSRETQGELARFLNARKKVDSTNPYLFTSNGKLQYEHPRNIETFIAQIRGEKPITPHAFRRTLNTLRKKIGCSLEDREFLINQKVSMNGEHYTKLSIKDKLALYDKYHPF